MLLLGGKSVTRDQLPLIMRSLYIQLILVLLYWMEISAYAQTTLSLLFFFEKNYLITAVAHVGCSMLYQTNLLVMAVKM